MNFDEHRTASKDYDLAYNNTTNVQNTIYAPIHVNDEYDQQIQNKENEDEEDADNVNMETALLNKASSFSCYVCLANTIMGAGMLGLPYAFAQSGWLLGSFLMCLCAASSAFSLHELSVCAVKSKLPSSFYSVAMVAAPQWVWLIDFAVAIKCFGVATSYIIIVGDLMPEAMSQLGADSAFHNREIWIGICLLIVIPIAFLNSLEKLKFTSTMSVIFVSYVAIVIVLFAMNIDSLDPCVDIVADGNECVGEKYPM